MWIRKKKNQDLCIHTYIYYNYLQGCPDLPQPSGIQLSCQNTNILKWRSNHQKATWGNLSHFQLVIKKLRSAPWAKKKIQCKEKRTGHQNQLPHMSEKLGGFLLAFRNNCQGDLQFLIHTSLLFALLRSVMLQ